MNLLLKLISFLLAFLTAAVVSWLFLFLGYTLAVMIEPGTLFSSFLLLVGVVFIFVMVCDKAFVFWKSKLLRKKMVEESATDANAR